MGEIKQTCIADGFYKSRLTAKVIQEKHIKKHIFQCRLLCHILTLPKKIQMLSSH